MTNTPLFATLLKIIIAWSDLRELIIGTDITRRYAVDGKQHLNFFFFFFLNIIACLAVYLRKIVEKIPRKFSLSVCP